MSLLTTHSQARIIQQLLIDLGVGISPSTLRLGSGSGIDDWPIFTTKEPDRPDDCITVYDTQGIIDGCSQIDGEWYEQVGFQVRIRCAVQEEGRAKAKDVAYTLDRVILRNSVTIDGTEYCVHSTNRTGGIIPLPQENSTSRRLFTVNGTTYIEEL